MQITSGVIATDGVVFNTTYYDPSIVYGSTAIIVISNSGNVISTITPALVPITQAGNVISTITPALVPITQAGTTISTIAPALVPITINL